MIPVAFKLLLTERKTQQRKWDQYKTACTQNLFT